MSRIRLGDMLVQAQMVTAEHVDEALALQKERGGRLGELLVELGYVSEVQLAQVLSNQLSVPWVNLYHVDFSRELLNLIPAELAEKYGCVPVYVRKVRKQGDTLFVATDDPTNETALIAIAQQAGMPVKPMVASSSDVRNAIRVYYFGGRETAATAPLTKRKAPSIAAPPPTAVRSSIAPVELDEAELEDPPAIPKAPAVPAELASVEAASVEAASVEAASVEAEPPAAPSPEPAVPAAPSPTTSAATTARKPRTITLTLLDGTTVTLPASGKKKPEEQAPQESLTTRDLIAALQARAEGKDVSAVLPDARWEPLFAALLSLLLRKGLIADWEFVEEWSKHRR